MRIRVDMFKETGKWAYGDVVEVGQARPWVTGEVELAVLENQAFVVPTAFKHYFIVLDEVPEEHYPHGFFFKRLYAPGDFVERMSLNDRKRLLDTGASVGRTDRHQDTDKTD